MCHQYWNVCIILKLPHRCHPFFRVFWGQCVFKKNQTPLTCLKKHTRYSLCYFFGDVFPLLGIVLLLLLITNLYRESLIRAFSFGWNGQHNYAPPWRKLSKPHLKLLDHFTVKCLQLHLLICQVTVTLAIRRGLFVHPSCTRQSC